MSSRRYIINIISLNRFFFKRKPGEKYTNIKPEFAAISEIFTLSLKISKKIFHSLLTKKDIYYRIYVYGYFMPSEKCMKFTDKEMII